jgi:iron only hydrogenase large subunit-like protein
MLKYFHSVKLNPDNCKGCTICIKRCPTEAIRVREGQAVIIEERCIDCGECIRICPNRAKLAITDPLKRLGDYKHTIALPAPSLYAQFKQRVSPGHILGALLDIGFDDYYEVALGAEAVSGYLRKFLASANCPRTMISSACPAVVRLMQVRFPGLLENIVPIESPMEISARLARERAVAARGFKDDEIGVFFITPCPAKVTAVKQPFGPRSYVDGCISMNEIYGEMLGRLDSPGHKAPDAASPAGGVGWGKAGGENHAVRNHSLLAVDGIHNVINLLEEIERGGLRDIDYIEAQSCTGGCIGGPLVPQNPFVSRARMENLVKELRGQACDLPAMPDNPQFYHLKKAILPLTSMKLNNDIHTAIVMLKDVERIAASLPGLDCGSCGSPSCRALAEDIVRGYAETNYCIFNLREKLKLLAREIVDLAHVQPPAMGRETQSAGDKGLE